MCRMGRAQESLHYAVCCAFLQSETCNLPSGPSGWLANTKTTVALPGPSLANILGTHRPGKPSSLHHLADYTVLALAKNYLVTSRPPANRGPSDTPLCFLSRSKTPHLDEEEPDCAKPSQSLKGLKCPLTHYVKSG